MFIIYESNQVKKKLERPSRVPFRVCVAGPAAAFWRLQFFNLTPAEPELSLSGSLINWNEVSHPGSL